NHSRAVSIVAASKAAHGRWSGSESTRCLRARSPGFQSVGLDRVTVSPTRARGRVVASSIVLRVAEHRSASPASHPVAQGDWTMRKIATPLIVLGLVACFAVPALASSLLSETFTYPDGNLAGNGPWAVYSGTPPTDIQVVSGRAQGNHANAPDDHALFAAQS